MAKKTTHKSAPQVATPDAQQIKAVRRAMEESDHDGARRRLQSLRKRFPDYMPLYGLACENELESGDPILAAMIAWDWAQRAPKSIKAHESLAVSADYAGYPAIIELAERALAALRKDEYEPINELDSPFGPLRFEDWLATDLCNMFLANQRQDEAIAAIKTATHPIARHQFVMALFARADIAAAAAVAEDLARSHPEFIGAMERAVRLRIYRDGLPAARELQGALSAARPQSSLEAWSQIAGLLLLDADADAETAWTATEHAAFWEREAEEEDSGDGDDESYYADDEDQDEDEFDDDDDDDEFDDDEMPGRPDTPRAEFYYLGALCALRAGNLGMAELRTQTALELDGEDENARHLINLLDAANASGGTLTADQIPQYLGNLTDWVPLCWIEQLHAVEHLLGGPDKIPLMDGASLDYLELMLRLGGLASNQAALYALRARMLDGAPGARALLEKYADSPCLPELWQDLARSMLEPDAPA
ncbi:MAG: hypothetical protein JNJ60_03940 [Rhodocyclaceae bacterium]|nr:hypothetical protein [Rhodocyclaceae bacterium]